MVRTRNCYRTISRFDRYSPVRKTGSPDCQNHTIRNFTDFFFGCRNGSLLYLAQIHVPFEYGGRKRSSKLCQRKMNSTYKENIDILDILSIYIVYYRHEISKNAI